MKLLVTGSHTADDEEFVHYILTTANRKFKVGFTSLVHGDAPGVDTFAANWAVKNSVKPIPYPADWTRHGKAAGPIRNLQMWTVEYEQQTPLNKIEIVLSFPGGPGTANMTKIALTRQRLGFYVPVYKVFANGLKLLNRVNAEQAEMFSAAGLGDELC